MRKMNTTPAKLAVKIHKSFSKRKQFDKQSLSLLHKRLVDPSNRRALMTEYKNHLGPKFVNRLRAFWKWVWVNRESLLRALGLVIVLLDNGQPVIRDAAEVEEEAKAKKPAKRKRKPKAKPDIGIVNEPKPVQLDSPEEADGLQPEKLHEVGGESDSDAAPLPWSDVVQEIPVAEDGPEH